jgi:translation initiation factor IF-3
VPIPRRFDRRPPERDTTRINERIRVPQLRLIGEDGQQIGIVKRDEALAYARERDLDLVEIAAEADPPVCRVLDYSKYKYEQEQKRKAARKHQQQVTVREMKLRPKIAQNDYETKKGHVLRFLKQHDKVKVTIMFRGREVAHPERGEALLMKLADELSEFGTIEQHPSQEGRNMTMMLGPTRASGNSQRPEQRSSGNGKNRAETTGRPTTPNEKSAATQNQKSAATQRQESAGTEEGSAAAKNEAASTKGDSAAPVQPGTPG